ncbi:hypothetical protein [Actinoallomurus sp. CA-150999]|uniref:hypothetical protein n=1 Tax=Actinoallomurus sp. CA-150999 TaxID=3239887 RepID=UPI003D8B7D3E
MTPNPQDAILEEFAAYYNADELEGFIHDGLAEQVDDSATRMVHILGDRAAEVADLLREMAADPAHPLFETIGTQTMYDWNTPDSWAKLKEIARRMADGITAATGSV